METKKPVIEKENKSTLTLINRKKLSMSGILEVVSFKDIEIVLKTSLGEMVIKGEDLKMNKLDVQNGDIVIIGEINSLLYTGRDSSDKESILRKLFK
ncbi:MAG: sporulation protein YabP [Bacillota bacterium]|nr:sporulation protein YabP [Bacillota bacterium]